MGNGSISDVGEERFDEVVVGIAADRAPEPLTEWTLRMIDSRS